jgi:hypothetical protein
MSYQPIENYGIIGKHAHCCPCRHKRFDRLVLLPHVDSPSIFGAILDDKEEGRFQISAGLMACGASSFIGLPPTSHTNTRLRRKTPDLGPSGVCYPFENTL